MKMIWLSPMNELRTSHSSGISIAALPEHQYVDAQRRDANACLSPEDAGSGRWTLGTVSPT
jgi:hypothetical protein